MSTFDPMPPRPGHAGAVRVLAGAVVALVLAGGAVVATGALDGPAGGPLSASAFLEFPRHRPAPPARSTPARPPAPADASAPLAHRPAPAPAQPTPTDRPAVSAPDTTPAPAPAPQQQQQQQQQQQHQPNLFDLPADTVAAPPPELKKLTDAAERGDPAAAIVMIEDYRHQSGMQHTARLDELVELSLDRLWWQRITELLAARQKSMQRLGQLRQEQARTTSPQRLQSLAAELKTVQSEVDDATRDLQDMRYTASTPPDLRNPQALQRLRADRDPMTYGYWRMRTMTSLIRTRGLAPWMVR